MFWKRVTVFYLFLLLGLCGCSAQDNSPFLLKEKKVASNETEILPDKIAIVSCGARYCAQAHDRLAELLTPEESALFQTAMVLRLSKIAEDFKQNGELYEAWNRNKYVSLQISLEGRDYSLHEMIELIRGTLKDVTYPLLLSDSFKIYFTPEEEISLSPLSFAISNILDSCADILITIGNVDDFVSIIKLWNSWSDQICVYDFMSYNRYCAIKDHMVHSIEKVYPEPFISTNVQPIIDILRETSTNLDMALDFYLFSERAIIANIASSILTNTNKDEYEEARKTIRYLDAIIKKRIFLKTQKMYSEEWWLSADIPQTEPSELEYAANEVLKNLIAIRLLYVPGCIRINERCKARIDALINKFNAVL